MRVLSCLALSATAAAAAPTAADLLSSQYAYTFEEFKSDFGKDYADASEHAARRAAFHAKLKDIAAHNDAAAGHSWKKGVNQFSDMLDAERELPRGLARGAAAARRAAAPVPSSAHLATAFGGDAAALPPSVDWRDHKPPVISAVKDQGGCGSCWAFATTETVESYVALATGKLPVLSPQQLVQCAPNADHCGGTGGCQGSIPEVAAAYIEAHGMTTEWRMPYASYFGDGGSGGSGGAQPACNATRVDALATVHVGGWKKLTPNSYGEVAAALASVGPLAVNVQANVWSDYESGVFKGCSNLTNIEVDHVVQLVGYGTDNGQDYFTIRNSWDVTWGESGFMRMARAGGGGGAPVCGTDPVPLDGTGCTGGPPTQHVCGTCGILFDVSYPTGAGIGKPTTRA